jgi:phosphate transport system permease protein
MAGVVLGMGRAIGETMAVLMVGGNAPNLSRGLTDSVRTLTMNIVTDMSYADGYHLTALFTTAIALFIFILANNMVVHLILKKSRLLEEI